MAEMFNFAEVTADMKPAEILNYYRNLYYAEPQVTERGILANAINEILPNMVEVVRCGQCKYWKINPCNLYGGYCHYCDSAKIDHFCSYGERKTT